VNKEEKKKKRKEKSLGDYDVSKKYRKGIF
jgi:hypothetical protein